MMIRRYLDLAEHKVEANRRIQYLKAAWNCGQPTVRASSQINPCERVTLNEVQPRERYVEDWEFHLVQEIIHQTTRSPYLAVMMEFAYLCRLRNSEVRNLKHSDIQNGTIRITRSKGSLGELTRISPRLQAAVDAAKAINPDAPTPSREHGCYMMQRA